MKDNDAHTMRELCLTDLFFLLTVGLKRMDANRDWIYARCREVEASPDGHLDLWSREHYKSTIITFAKLIQDILNDPEVTIGIFSHTRPNAKAFLAQIAREFEGNSFLKGLFPDVLFADPRKESPKWSLDEGIIVKRKGNPKESTVEAWGLVDGQPTSKHYRILNYDDIVTRESVTTPEMMLKTTQAWELSMNLGTEDGVVRYIGTRYHCLAGDTRILMSDWSHKKIKDVNIGDEVIGWYMNDCKNDSVKRYLKKSKVMNVGKYENQQVKEFKFNIGRSVVATPDHKWWRGPHGSGSEYKELGLHYHKMKSVRRLLDPCMCDESRDAGWLAGIYDGEGSFRKNTYHPSGTINITQTLRSPDVVDKIRNILDNFGFECAEDWENCDDDKSGISKHDKCVWHIYGGWKERYRFLKQINPSKSKQIEDSLFGQMLTDKVELIEILDKSDEDVYWIETETGNYIAEGFCSKNSNDTYATMIERGSVKVRLHPATDDGTLGGNPVLWSKELFEIKVRDYGSYTSSCQLLQNPLADKATGFSMSWLEYYDVLREGRGQKWNYYLLCDPATEKKKDSDYTAMLVIGLAPDGNYYLVDGVRDRLNLTERTSLLFRLHRKWHPVAVGYEKYGMQSDIDHIKYVQGLEGYRFRIIELGGSMPKNDRIRRLVPIFENHRFWLPRSLNFVSNSGKVVDLIREFIDNEYVTFPVGKHDDMLDCMSRICDDALGARFPKVGEKMPMGLPVAEQRPYDPLVIGVSQNVSYAKPTNRLTTWDKLMRNN